jgi:hypothetical protein
MNSRLAGACRLGLAALISALAGCPADDGAGMSAEPAAAPGEIVDTTGARFGLPCAQPKFCEVTPLAGASTALTCAGKSTEQVYVLFPESRVLRLCAVERSGSDGYTANAGFCRPVACPNGSGCPWERTCSNGICQIPTAPLQLDDAVGLCTAGVSWPTTCEELVTNYSAAFALQMEAVVSCPSNTNCKVPAACRQP